jgi:hypothetical protein
VLPHYTRDDYRQHPPLDPRAVDVDTYRIRWERQIQPIGETTRTNVTDPVDRTIVRQTGVIRLQHRRGEVLALAAATNGRLTFQTLLDADQRDQAISFGQTLQPRGIQRVPGGPPHIFNVPADVPASAARP